MQGDLLITNDPEANRLLAEDPLALPGARVDWHPAEDLIVFGDHDIGAEESTDDPTNLHGDLFRSRPGLPAPTDDRDRGADEILALEAVDVEDEGIADQHMQ